MKIKVTITNFESFCKAIADCKKSVVWVDGDVKKKLDDVKRMEELHVKFAGSGKLLNVWLETSQKSDYFRLLSCCCWGN